MSKFRDELLADQQSPRESRRKIDQYKGDLREACLDARTLYREGQIADVTRLHGYLQNKFGKKVFDAGRSTFREWLKAEDGA